MEIAARQTGPGIVTAGVAVVLAFYAVMLANFPGLAELGFIAGSGELLCMVASFTVLPALLAVSQRYLRTRAGSMAGAGAPELDWVGLGVFHVLRWRALVCSPSSVCSCRRSRNSTTTCCICRRKVLSQWYGKTVSWRNRTVRRGMRSARPIHLLNCSRKKAQFAALPVVDRVESLASMLPPNQEERLALVAEIAPLVDAISATWENVAPIDVEELSTTLEKIRFKLQRPPTDWDPAKAAVGGGPHRSAYGPDRRAGASQDRASCHGEPGPGCLSTGLDGRLCREMDVAAA